MADRIGYLLSLAVAADFVKKTDALPAVKPGSKEDRALLKAKDRRGPNSANKS